EHNGADLVTPGGELSLVFGAPHGPVISTGPRVGVAGDGGDGERYPWRYWLAGEPSVSPYRRHVARRPAKPDRVTPG
ncbi:MAG: hypothetical protein ACRDVZ_16510, partial [Jiangellaceae bacterium]